MNWKPNTNSYVRKQRARMLQNIRAFFYDRNVLEVETPALSKAANTDPYIESFGVPTDSNSMRYLHTSPEYPMKRLLAAGSGDIYQVCKVWRNGESGKNHNPEFTMLEWYRLDFSYQQLIQEVDALLSDLFSSIEEPSTERNSKTLKQPALIISYQQLFLEKLNINPHTVSLSDLVACCNTNINTLDTRDLKHQDMLDALLTHCIEPDFSVNRLTFVIDYPESQSALARLKQCSNNGVDYSVAERFEVYFGSLELGNGYQEETGYQRNCDVLKYENHLRAERLQQQMPEDKFFKDGCKAGIPYCSGVALGLDRVLMALLGKNDIKDVINFTWDNS